MKLIQWLLGTIKVEILDLPEVQSYSPTFDSLGYTFQPEQILCVSPVLTLSPANCQAVGPAPKYAFRVLLTRDSQIEFSGEKEETVTAQRETFVRTWNEHL